MADAANPYQAPRAAVNEAPEETQPVEVFSVSGRIGRVRYIAYSVGFYILIMVVAGILAAVLGSAAWIALVLGWVSLLVILFMLTIQRCHDFDMSGWLSLLVLVPFVNLIFWIIPPTRGANRWGPPTPKNGAGVIIAACLPVLFIPLVGILAAVALPAYQDYTYRAKISEVIQLGSSYRTPIAEYYVETRRMPSSAAELSKYGVPASEARYGRATVGPDGSVTLTLSAQMGRLVDRTIVLRPQMAGGQIAGWDCTGGTLEARYRPASCRAPR